MSQSDNRVLAEYPRQRTAIRWAIRELRKSVHQALIHALLLIYSYYSVLYAMGTLISLVGTGFLIGVSLSL